MGLPFSKSQVVRLGERLVGAREPGDADLSMLSDLLIAYDETLANALEVVRDLGYDPTGRVKNTGTILEKLERHGGSWLKSIQDLAGMRVVLDGGWSTQDETVSRLQEAFADCSRQPRIVDRRRDPSHGYRAVHVIVYPDGLPVEIQVRTTWQHEWAEVFEKLADRVGRGIRYGEAPAHWWHRIAEDFAAEAPGSRKAVAMKAIYEAAYRHHESLVALGLALGDMIGVLEAAEASYWEGLEDVDRLEGWTLVRESLADFRETLAEMGTVADRPDLGTVSS